MRINIANYFGKETYKIQNTCSISKIKLKLFSLLYIQFLFSETKC